MSMVRVGWLSLGLAGFWAVFVPLSRAADPPAAPSAPTGRAAASPAPRAETEASEAAPATSNVAPADVTELKHQVADALDTMDVADLKAKLERAQAALSLAGQSIMKDRAVLRRKQAKFATRLKACEGDSQIRATETILANPGFRDELARVASISDPKAQLAAFADVLNKNHVETSALWGVIDSRNAKAQSQLCETCIANAESQLKALQSSIAAGETTPLHISSMDPDLTELAGRYGSGTAPQNPSRPETSNGDLAALLKALTSNSAGDAAAKH